MARSSSIQGSQRPGSARSTGIPGNMSAIAIARSGTVRPTLIQKRRVMLRNSGFSSSVAVIVRGSSAMPQIGQNPGPGRTISGCIGHVYSLRVAGKAVSRSSAMPQLGQGPGLLARTWGHMGQT